jgi:hypothetical protein
MGLHTYCIVSAGRQPPPGLRGIDDGAVREIDVVDLAVWTSSHATPPTATLDAVRAHSAVVASAMDRTCTPVPIRFGHWLETESALAERVGAEHARWSALLARFTGRAEYGTTVSRQAEQTARDVHAGAALTGTAYMQKLARRQAETATRRQLAEEIADVIARRLGGLDVELRAETPGEGALLTRLAHLVAWADVEAYHLVMQEFSASRRDLVVQLTGPWPPWSFVG